MTTTITSVTPQSADHRTAVAVSTTLVPVRWILTRSYGASIEAVRGDDPADATKFLASGATRTLFDVEAPRGVSVTYVVTAIEADGDQESSIPSSGVVLDGDRRWWVHPLIEPRLHQEFDMGVQPRRVHGISNGKFWAVGRADPIITFGKRRTPEGDLTATVYTLAESDVLVDVVEMEQVMVVRSPERSGWSRRYVVFDTVTDLRATRLAVTPHTIDLPWTQVVPPAVPVVGFGSTWQDVIDNFATWQDVINAFSTWDALLAWSPS